MQDSLQTDVISKIDMRKSTGGQKVVDKTQRFIQIVGVAFTGLLSILCILPFVLIISASFSSERSIVLQGFSIIPKELSLDAYNLIFNNPEQILGSYALTISMTVIGTLVGLFIISMTGYALQRPDFPLKYYIFTYTLPLYFQGTYTIYMMVTQTLKLKDNYLAVLFYLCLCHHG